MILLLDIIFLFISIVITSRMLTESNFHHHHHNSGPVIPQHRIHYAPYQHSTKSIQPILHHAQQPPLPQQQQPQPQQFPSSDVQLPKFDLHHAVRTNDVTGIIRLHSRLRQQPAVADTCLLDANGHTPLHTAIANGRLAMVDLLLHLGHNPVSSVHQRAEDSVVFARSTAVYQLFIIDHVEFSKSSASYFSFGMGESDVRHAALDSQ